MILLLCATKPEWGELKKSFPNYKRDSGIDVPFYDLGSGVQLCQIGLGSERAAHNVKKLLDTLTPKPKLVVHFGLAGGLDPRLKVGDLVLPDKILCEAGGLIAIDAGLLKNAARGLRTAFFSGSLYSSSSVLETPDQKQKIYKETLALAVDMESFTVAILCRERGISYVSIRAIFDPFDWNLADLAAAQSIDAGGEVNKKGLAIGVCKNPRLLLGLPKYQRAASFANKVITRALLEFVA